MAIVLIANNLRMKYISCLGSSLQNSRQTCLTRSFSLSSMNMTRKFSSDWNICRFMKFQKITENLLKIQRGLWQNQWERPLPFPSEKLENSTKKTGKLQIEWKMRSQHKFSGSNAEEGREDLAIQGSRGLAAIFWVRIRPFYLLHQKSYVYMIDHLHQKPSLPEKVMFLWLIIFTRNLFHVLAGGVELERALFLLDCEVSFLI